MLDVCNKMLNEKEEEIISLEKDINPLLSDDSQVAFSWVLENVVANMRAMPESWPFHKPVSSKMVRDYYDVVKNPMNLETLRQVSILLSFGVICHRPSSFGGITLINPHNIFL